MHDVFTEPVKGRNTHFVRIGPNPGSQSTTHLCGTVLRKGQAQNVIRMRVCLLQDVRNTRREHMRLAGPRSGENQYGTVDLIDGLTLGGVEVF